MVPNALEVIAVRRAGEVRRVGGVEQLNTQANDFDRKSAITEVAPSPEPEIASPVTPPLGKYSEHVAVVPPVDYRKVRSTESGRRSNGRPPVPCPAAVNRLA